MELVFLMVLFFVISLIQRAAQKAKGQQQEPPPRRKVRAPGRSGPAERPQSVRDLFAEVRRQMEEAQRQAEIEAGGPVLEAEVLDEIEERETLEIEPVARSLEVAPARPERAVVDFDDQAEAVIRRRIKWAEEQAKGRTADEHRAFDERIRRPKPRPKIVRSRAPELRQMVIWQEVLGRPVALREEPGPFDPRV